MEVSEGKGLSFNGIRNIPEIKKFSMKPCQPQNSGFGEPVGSRRL